MVARDASKEPTPEKEVILGFVTVEQLAIGMKAWVEKGSEFRKAEILKIETRKSGILRYYVHYVEFNKRLDEWLNADRIDLTRQVEWPAPEKPVVPKKAVAGKADTAVSSPAPLKTVKNQKKRGTATRDSISAIADGNSPAPSIRPAKRQRASGKENEEEPAVARVRFDSADPTIHSPDDREQDDPSNEIALLETPSGDVIDSNLDDPTQDIEPSNFSKEKEIEKLRTSGSMTQSAHEVSRVRNLTKLQMGAHEVETWYFSPYPVEFTEEEIIFVCEFCLSYFAEKKRYERHRCKCELLHPPGNEIYRDENVSFFEIDGRRQRTWCRNLCLLSKCFLDHKTLYYDVDPFLFYCMTSRDARGCHLIGYFSKEKESAENYNVACILTLPQYQRTGFGRLLIAFSYELSKREGKLGSPEKPLSDLGLLGYRAYWQEIIVELLHDLKENPTKGEIGVDDVAARLAMTTNDVVHTLQNLNMIKYFKGQHVICLNKGVLAQKERLLEKQKIKGKRVINSELLKWKPPVFSAASKTWNW